ncbi:MAG: NAD(P)/FAD-dependent oxidoreductase [Candidatus Sumerlaeia bacterium]|nr:NAD(P)/FAD-dependent oxidoreductase [Candidatus Sumerlaeia bacterium]
MSSIPSPSSKPVIVIGGGAAGLMAAGRAGELGAPVLLLEKTDGCGKKILLSGKTRCNLTNTAPLSEFIAAYGPNGRFLHGAFSRFFRDELIALLARYGVAVKTERGGRVFPASDAARDVVHALERFARENKAVIQTTTRALTIETSPSPHSQSAIRVAAVRTDRATLPAAAVILAAGGASYPSTGSTGDGYEMARALGHTIVPLRAALVPLVVEETARAKAMQGVSLRNVRLTAFQCRADQIEPDRVPLYDCGRGIAGRKARPPVLESRFGEMMMTHFGIGGPITLQMSLAIVDALERGPVSVAIDLKPALSREQLRRRLQRDFDRHGRRTFRNILKDLLPAKMGEPFVELCGIASDKPANQISADERDRLAALLKSLRFNIRGPLPLTAAIVTAGGVALSEVDPCTMESRRVGGLYFCGEVLDLDADTGGFNLQAAFSTGYVAGESAARATQTNPRRSTAS